MWLGRQLETTVLAPTMVGSLWSLESICTVKGHKVLYAMTEKCAVNLKLLYFVGA